MKTNIFRYAISLAAVFAAIVSCDNKQPEEQQEGPEKVDPIFPSSVVNETVEAGQSVDLRFEPNMEWKVEISGEGKGNIFWIDDAGMKATSVSSKETGPQVVTIVFSENEEFDKNRVCDVTLTMGGESKKIATYTRPSLGRTFEVYAGVPGEDGFSDGFGTTVLTELSLKSFTGQASYTLPIRVVTNYDWNLGLPTWLKAYDLDAGNEITNGQTGTTDILLTAVLTDDVADGASDFLRFVDKDNSDAANEVAITLPKFSDRMEYEINALEFNIAGEVLMPNGNYAEGSAVAYILAAKGFTVKALEWKGEYHDVSYADWVNVAIGEYDQSQGALQLVDVTIGVDANPGEFRSADLFVFPVSMGEVKADEICDMNDSSCGFKDEYGQYHIGRLIQAGDTPPYIVPISSEDLREEVGTYFSTLDPKGEDNILQWDFPSARTYHKISYTGEWSADEGSFDCAEPYASVKLFKDVEYPVGVFTAEVTSEEEHWVSFASFGGENMKGRFNMNYVPESATHTAAVFYNESGDILSAVLVEFNPAFTSEDGICPYAVASGAGEISVMDQASELYEAICGNYNVTDVYQILTNDRMLYVDSTVEFWNVLALDPVTFGEYTGPVSFEAASPDFYIYTGNGDSRSEVIYILQTLGADGVSMVNHSALHVIYDPAAEIEVEPPFSFVYPDYVGTMATLEKHTGEHAEAIITEWGASQAPKEIYLLTYNDPSAASVAVLNVPGSPTGDGAWNNYNPNTGKPYDEYWLTHEMNGTQMTIYMSEPGKYDYFLFMDATGLPYCALVCTMTGAE